MLCFDKMSDQKWSPLDEFRNAQPSNTFPSRRLPPILPPPVATITQSLPISAHLITLPRLPSMVAPPQVPLTSPVMGSTVSPQYYSPHAQPLPMQPGSPQHSNPPTAQQYSAPVAARQSKKEIKRRTKTGLVGNDCGIFVILMVACRCLTCRSRRIKVCPTSPYL